MTSITIDLPFLLLAIALVALFVPIVALLLHCVSKPRITYKLKTMSVNGSWPVLPGASSYSARPASKFEYHKLAVLADTVLFLKRATTSTTSKKVSCPELHAASVTASCTAQLVLLRP